MEGMPMQRRPAHGAYQKTMREAEDIALRTAVPPAYDHIALLWDRFFPFAASLRRSCADHSDAVENIKMEKKRRRNQTPSKKA